VSVYKLPLDQNRHSGGSRNPVLSTPSGCRIKSGMTKNGVYRQTLIINLSDNKRKDGIGNGVINIFLTEWNWLAIFLPVSV